MIKLQYFLCPHSRVWWWRLASKNGKQLALSSGSYTTKGNVKRACEKMAKHMQPGVPIEYLEHYA